MYAEQKRMCKGCNKSKDKKEFRRISRGKETTQPYCKDCRSIKEFVRGLMRNYGITKEQYEEMLLVQNSRCKCCGRHASEFKRRLHVDHDHITKKVRALLCTLCNPLIGFAKENPEALDMATNYLKSF